MGRETAVNTKGIAYFDADQAKGINDGLIIGESGEPEALLDKWGNPYQILLNFDPRDGINLNLLTPAPSDVAEYSPLRQTDTAVALSPGRDATFDGVNDSTSF